MPSWPGTLPQKPLVSGYRETPPETVIRSKMDVGPDKIRQRVTAGVRNFAVSFAISDTQFTTLDDFFTTTVKGGALSFDFPHPRTGATISVRFTSAPEYQPRGRGGGNWIASFTLEEIPA